MKSINGQAEIRMRLAGERRDELVKRYPQLETTFNRFGNLPDGLKYIMFFEAVLKLESPDQSDFTGIVDSSIRRRDNGITFPAVKCGYMNDTGKQANPKRPCMGNWIECSNPECPLDEHFSGYCTPDKCRFFEYDQISTQTTERIS